MRNRSTRVIVGLLLLTGVATSQLKEAGLIVTGSVMPTLSCLSPSTTLTFSEGDFPVTTAFTAPRYGSDGQPVSPTGGTIVTNQFQKAGVVFEARSERQAWVYLADKHDDAPAAPSPGSVLSTMMLGINNENITVTLLMKFVDPLNASPITVKGSSISFWAYGRGNGPLTFKSYDANGVLLETKTVTGGDASRRYGIVQFTTGNVERIEGVNTGLPRQGLAIDNLSYTINATDCPLLYATGPGGAVSDANGVIQVPSSSSVELTWNIPAATCTAYSVNGSTQWGNGKRFNEWLTGSAGRQEISCSGTTTLTNVTSSQTYYINTTSVEYKVSVVVKPDADAIAGLGTTASGTMKAYGPSGQTSDANGIIQVPSGSTVHVEWNNTEVGWCNAYSIIGTPSWGNSFTFNQWVTGSVGRYNVPCKGIVSIPNVTSSQTYYINNDTEQRVSIVVQPASGPISGLGGAAAGTMRAFGSSGETTSDGTITAPSGSTLTFEWKDSGTGWCSAYANQAVSGWGQGSTAKNQFYVPCTGILSVSNQTSPRTFTVENSMMRQVSFTPGSPSAQCNASDPRIACVTDAMQFTSAPVLGDGGKGKAIVYWDTPLSARDSLFAALSSCGLEPPSPSNFTSAAMEALVKGRVGQPTPYRPVFVDLNCSPANVNLYRSAGHKISDTDVGPGTDVTCTQQYLNYKVNFYANSTLTAAPVDPSSPGAVNIEGIGDGGIGYAAAICDPSQTSQCKAVDFDAAKGHFTAQGWTARAEPSGSVTPVTEDGVKAMRMTDDSSTTGVAMSVPIPASAIEDKDWSLEMRAKVRESVGHSLGINMLLLIPNHRHIGLYIAKDKFGPIDNSLAYIQPVSRNTTDAFHTYVVRHKKNGPGKEDDSIDVYFDGEKVISDVPVSSIANPPTGSDGFLSVGQLSSEGQGSMDVQYVRFWNDADPCVSYAVACGVAEFHASQGSPESQGWTSLADNDSSTNVTGPFTENGVTYLRLSDQSAVRGVNTRFLSIENSMLSDRDWTLEMRSRTVESDPGSYVLGMNMLLVTPDKISKSLFIDTDKFGLWGATPNAYTWGPSVNRNTKNAFHTYTIKNKKNGAGPADDTVDVYFDGTRVLSDIKTNQLYTYGTEEGVTGIGFGIGSSPGKGVMDVDYVKFKNDEASCPADPFKKLLPQCSDGIDNDGDGLIDYKVVTKTPVRSWGPVTVPITTNQVPAPRLSEGFTVVDSLVAGQVVKIGNSVSGSMQVPGYTGSNPCGLFIKNTYDYQNPVPLIGAFADAAGNNVQVGSNDNVTWFRIILEGEYVVPAGATKLMFYPMNNYSVSGNCTISGGQILQVSGEFGDPECTSADGLSESAAAPATCSDTDPTDRLDVQGFVNATGGPVTTASDACDELGKLTQYSCSPSKAVTSTSVSCPAGSACSEGACVGVSSSVAAVLNPTRTGFGGVVFDGNDVIFTPFRNGDAAYHGNVLAFGPVCKPATCGDGVLTSDEQCDDGNTVSGDGCNAKCIWEPYAGASSSRSSSSSSSSAARCGDGVITAPEQCDDGNTTGGDGCSAFCQVETGWQCTPRLP